MVGLKKLNSKKVLGYKNAKSGHVSMFFCDKIFTAVRSLLTEMRMSLVPVR